MISNLFRTPLQIFSGFVLAIFDLFGQYQRVLICYTPQSFLEWCIKPKKFRKGIMPPISNVLDTIIHMVRIHMSALTHFFNDCFRHFLALFDQYFCHSDQIKISRYPFSLF